ncbi:hypothetical protein TNIN_277041 [Trichonephila inaurata madagascariensis]|uniref:BED-type domain-containing protein n=1 Tax=Trichonephila inaurata madagascariensis TaxID=2747483 RepID=A0A8X7BMF7_9ARAC|nr:hypothetical protein TNIN_277041 [Trichonephila inaurata madagascariensis]
MDRKTSFVWTYFTVTDKISCRASCSICNQTISYQSSISNLKRHIKFKHPTVKLSSEKRKYIVVAPGTTNPLSSDASANVSGYENCVKNNSRLPKKQAVEGDETTEILPMVEFDRTLQNFVGSAQTPSSAHDAETDEIKGKESLENDPLEFRIKEELNTDDEQGPHIAYISSMTPGAHVPSEKPLEVPETKLPSSIEKALDRFCKMQEKQIAATEKLAAAIEMSSKRFAEQMSTSMKIFATVAQNQTQLMGILIDRCQA